MANRENELEPSSEQQEKGPDFSAKTWREFEAKFAGVEEIDKAKVKAHALPDADMMLTNVIQLCGSITRTGGLRRTVAELICDSERRSRGLIKAFSEVSNY